MPVCIIENSTEVYVTGKTQPTTKQLAASGSGVRLSHSFSPAPIVNQASDYTLTITNNTTKQITITSIIIDVGQGDLTATYNLAGVSTPPTASQDFMTFQITWSGKMPLSSMKTVKIMFPGGFTGIPSTITLPSITLVCTPAISPTIFPGPRVTIK
jgi:hypothetical protein